MGAEHMPTGSEQAPSSDASARAGSGAGWVATLALGVALAGVGGSLFLGGSALLAWWHPSSCEGLGLNDCTLVHELARGHAVRQLLVAVALLLLAAPTGAFAWRRNRGVPGGQE